MGNATSSGIYSSSEAAFVYTVLADCTEQSGVFNTSTLSLSSNEPADDLGNITDPASFFGQSETTIELGAIVWVPPQCESWYVTAPEIYDDYTTQGSSSILNWSNGAWQSDGSSSSFDPTKLRNVAGFGSLGGVPGFFGSDCGSTSTATSCVVSVLGVIQALLPYEVISSASTLASGSWSCASTYDGSPPSPASASSGPPKMRRPSPMSKRSTVCDSCKMDVRQASRWW